MELALELGQLALTTPASSSGSAATEAQRPPAMPEKTSSREAADPSSPRRFPGTSLAPVVTMARMAKELQCPGSAGARPIASRVP